jgi:hypothetical protein
MLLTPDQLHEISQIIADRHAAFIVNTVGPEAVAPQVLERLKGLGLVDIKIDSIRDAYLYGQAVAAAEVPGVQTMSYDQFKAHVRKNPIPLSEIEKDAITYAQQHAGQYCRGLGNRVDVQTGQVAIEADAELRREMRDKIMTATEEAVAKRKTLKQLKSDLGWATQDWTRDWERIANTEQQFAMQQGQKDYIAEEWGPDADVVCLIMPDRCPDCEEHYTEGGMPKIFKLSELEGNGTNVGKKRAAWLPVIPPMHPHCFLPNTLVSTDRGELPIAAVLPGDLVLTAAGNWQPVTHTWATIYDGSIVRARTANAEVMATSNHPFLVGSSWVPAAALNLGDELSYFRSEARSFIQTDMQYEPAISFKERSFAKILFGFSRAGVPVTAIHFDGKFYVREGKIDQEAVKLISNDGLISNLDQAFVDVAFGGRFEFTRLPSDGSQDEFFGLRFASDSGMESGEILSSLFWREFSHSDALAFGSISGLPALTPDSLSDHTSANPESLGYFFYRQQIVEVHIQDSLTIELVPVRSGCHSARVPTQDPIVNVSSQPYQGLVYNLTVAEENTFVANGFAAHNCQCQLQRVPPGYGFRFVGDPKKPEERKDPSNYQMISGGERKFAKSMSAEPLQKAAKNVRKYIDFQGIRIAIENPAGSVRHWEADGERGVTTMLVAYGYVVDTVGADTDGIDVFVGPVKNAPNAYVVHQQNPKTGTYDEDKVMLGFRNEREALTTYQLHFDRPDFAAMISPMPMDAFKRWIWAQGPKPYGLKKAMSEVPLVIKLEKGNVRSAGVVRGSESMAVEMAHAMPAERRGAAQGTAFNYAFDNPPAHRPPPVDMTPTGSPFNPGKIPYSDAAVKRDPKDYEYQEPVKVRPVSLIIPADYRGGIVGTGEAKRNRGKVEDQWQQDLAATKNTVEAEDSDRKPKSKTKKKGGKRPKKRKPKKELEDENDDENLTLH